MNNKIAKHFELLGLRVQDRVTGLEGVVISVSFDLYGCIQAIVHPGLDKDGKNKESLWYDVGRLRVLSDAPVMDRPDYANDVIAEGKKGPADKPFSQRFA